MDVSYVTGPFAMVKRLEPGGCGRLNPKNPPSHLVIADGLRPGNEYRVYLDEITDEAAAVMGEWIPRETS